MRDGEREGREEGEKGREKRKGKGGEEGKGRVPPPPLSEILNTPLVIAYFVFEFCEASATDTATSVVLYSVASDDIHRRVAVL